MLLKQAANDSPLQTLHLLPAGATRCKACGLSAPRMRMFYTDSVEVYNAVDVGDLPGGLPMLIDAEGQRFRADVCSPCPF